MSQRGAVHQRNLLESINLGKCGDGLFGFRQHKRCVVRGVRGGGNTTHFDTAVSVRLLSPRRRISEGGGVSPRWRLGLVYSLLM
jgi:hypothetical protein